MRLSIIILLLFIAVVLFGCDMGSKEGCVCSRDEVCVNVINRSGQEIKKVYLTHEGISIDDGEVGMEEDDRVCWSFLSPGENSFFMKAILSSGDTVISNEVYSEGGYKFSANIRSDSISIEYIKENLGY